MLKSITFIIGLFTCLSGNCQNSKMAFAVEIGANYSNSSEVTAPLKKIPLILPRIGVVVDCKISEAFFLESGLIYAMKGLKSKGDGEKDDMTIHADVELRQHLFQIPILIGKRIYIKKHQISFLTGIYTSCGVGGNTKAKGIINGINFDKEVRTFDYNSLLNRFDGGFVFKSNYLLTNNIYIDLSYELGLIDIGNLNIMGGELHYKNRCLVLAMRYRF